MSDPIDKEAEAAWEAFAAKTDSYGGPAWIIAAIWKAGFRAARSAAPVAPSDNRACGKSYGPMSVMCRRLAGHVGDCGPSAGDELVTVQLAEARARVKHLQELERKGEDIGDMTAPDKPALKAAAEVAIKQGFGVWTGPDSAYSYGGSVLAELEVARSEIRDLETQVFELQMGDDL